MKITLILLSAFAATVCDAGETGAGLMDLCVNEAGLQKFDTLYDCIRFLRENYGPGAISGKVTI